MSRLPLTKPALCNITGPTHRRQEMTIQQASKILVIDDEITERMLVKEYLEEAGFRVRLSEDGKHGLRMATTTSPDLIIVDAMLPSIDGYAICPTFRLDPRTAEVPII